MPFVLSDWTSACAPVSSGMTLPAGLVQVALAGDALRDLGGARRGRGAALGVAPVEQLVHQPDHLADLAVAEVAREQRLHVLDHVAALRRLDGVLRRPDEDHAA